MSQSKNTIELKILSLKEMVYHDHADSVTLPTTSGQITVLPHHVPLISRLKQGTILVSANKEKKAFETSGGFLEIAGGNRLTVLLA